MKPTPVVALIDADTIIYEAATTTERATQWDAELSTLHGFVPEAFRVFSDKVQAIVEKVQADKFVLALSDRKGRWREKYLSTYKQNRAGSRKPVHFFPLLDAVEEAYSEQVYIRPLLEADDVLGILATHPTIVKGEKVVVSIDKDLKTIPGNHYNYRSETVFDINEDEADYNHLLQTLMGDATDGYAGCPGVGVVTARKILEPFIEETAESGDFDTILQPAAAWQAVVAAFAKKGLSEEIALQNARVARICRHTDYDFKKKEVILWNPPR